MRDGLPYQGNDHREAIEQLFEINKIYPNMCEGGKKLTQKISTVTSLSRRCMRRRASSLLSGADATYAMRTKSWTS